MAKNIPIEEMDSFCDHLFRALDRADLLPLRLSEPAHSFEKYGRTLASLLERYDQVEAAFDEWETRTLRQMKNAFRRDEVYPHFQLLRNWLVENRIMFEDEGRKDNLNHFKRSLYGRLYTWLYPRRKLAMAYADIYRGDAAQFELEILEKQFRSTTQNTMEALPGVNDQAVYDAQAYVLMKKAYYKRNKDAQAASENENDEQGEIDHV
ncbi:MAG TPA: hypothetical protein PLD25_31135 [Chloroflexota bacterium]|nr:hypothetical protein [Chloroflexota bacterium]HUM67883.1 hypothetical protein [Chloroflexota bacterium]